MDELRTNGVTRLGLLVDQQSSTGAAAAAAGQLAASAPRRPSADRRLIHFTQ